MKRYKSLFKRVLFFETWNSLLRHVPNVAMPFASILEPLVSDALLVVTSATLVVTGALLVVTMFAIRNKCIA